MKFTNKLGVYTVQGRALENYKIMQCKPAYRRYKIQLKMDCKRMGVDDLDPLPFDIFADLHTQRQNELKQAQML